ncbi:hypothetical protein SAPIO_CDS4965 [Aspergillus terreus]|uniref:Uncharacterized protein n=1 Tax=Aspergillus terreus TaxID=33178 RepID=A0A5M3YR61_ASPTE|nr:hypothetical protein ATETN484_0002065400 [Aspergillus terreus]GFF15510.1 hypothetical protein SAPIO_CDS4965 [Aspergillus terreus]
MQRHMIRKPSAALYGSSKAAILCAQHRGDSVPKLFHDLAADRGSEDTRKLFHTFKQAITITWAFIGLPHCIPACLGLVNEMRDRGITIGAGLDRPSLEEADWLKEGEQTKQAIYRAVGNSEVGEMMGQYFPEISYVATTAVFGFLIGGSAHVQSLPFSEITLAGAIAAMGATRQARSHFKGAMGLGVSVSAVQAVLDVVRKIAAWNLVELPGEIDVLALAAEVRTNLHALGKAPE